MVYIVVLIRVAPSAATMGILFRMNHEVSGATLYLPEHLRGS